MYEVYSNRIMIILGQQCLTTNDSPDKNVPCALPFKFNGELKNACITDTDPDGRYWCSTKVNPRTKEHIGGQGKWGFCQNSCPPIAPITPDNTARTEGE